MEATQFWQTMSDDDFFYKYIISVQEAEWKQIISKWSNSSVDLKKWINKYFPEEFGKYDSLADINVNVILPYRNNGFWKNNDLWRLEYAIKAKLIILGQYGLDEIRMKYVVECLRLWLRFDSRYTDLSWDQFKGLVDKCYVEAETDWEGTVISVQEVCYKYKHKRKQTLYHYKEADFNIVSEYMKLGEAYDFWITYEWPSLLDRFKQEKIKEFRMNELKDGHFKINTEKWTKFKADLDLVKIKKPSKEAFRKLLERNNIPYKKTL